MPRKVGVGPDQRESLAAVMCGDVQVARVRAQHVREPLLELAVRRQAGQIVVTA
jgi:hypothetical protein